MNSGLRFETSLSSSGRPSDALRMQALQNAYIHGNANAVGSKESALHVRSREPGVLGRRTIWTSLKAGDALLLRVAGGRTGVLSRSPPTVPPHLSSDPVRAELLRHLYLRFARLSTFWRSEARAQAI